MFERLAALRALMAREGMDAYIVPTADFHESEYVGDYFKCRQWLTGFSGSAGVAIVTRDEARMWTDGRYFIQAEKELAPYGFTLMRMAEKGVPTVTEYLGEKLPQNGCVGFDGRVMNQHLYEDFKKAVSAKNATFKVQKDLIGELWTNRPALSHEKAWLLTLDQCGVSVRDKLALIRKDMEEKAADALIVSDLGCIAWLMNMRGNDVEHCPYVLSFALLTKDCAKLYIQSEAVTEDVKAALEAEGVTLCPYFAIYDDLKALTCCALWMDGAKLNSAACDCLPKSVKRLDKPLSIIKRKAIKNDVEITNTINAHIKDGVAVTRFMYWLKTNIGKIPMTEITASDYLAARRAEQEGFLDLSFGTISAYNANAAMMHYSAQEGSEATLAPQGFLLVDSGGHYRDGTTDITRTYVLGDLPYEWKVHYTAVLRGMINLAGANFLYGCRGVNLDILARGPMWDMDIDYKCGTGHGVSFIGSVHEPPNGVRWRIVPERDDSCILEAGMITTDEPGIYMEGSHGIRTENELLCVKGNEVGSDQFMHFEAITFSPIDLDAVLPEKMTKPEIDYLNHYHATVYEKISPFLPENEKEWLKTVTRAI